MVDPLMPMAGERGTNVNRCIVCMGLRAMERRPSHGDQELVAAQWVDWYQRDQPEAGACEDHTVELAAAVLRNEERHVIDGALSCLKCSNGLIAGHNKYRGDGHSFCSEYCAREYRA